MDGRPRVYPPGHPKAGQPKISYFFAVAIPKAANETAWWDTAWGKEAVAIASAAWPQGQWQTPSFAWKIEDGDSTIPNKRGRRNAASEGFPGNWIVNFSSGFAPKIILPGNPPQPLVEPDVVKLGYWVEVLGTIRSNETASNPGIYVNHDMVAFRGRDKEIFAGIDPASVPFGQSAVPSHVTMAPTASGGSGFPAQLPQAGAPAVPGGMPMQGGPASPAVPSMPGAPVGAGVAVPGGTPLAVQPSASFIAPPVAGAPSPALPAAPAAPSAPPAQAYVDPAGAPPGYRMANPQGARYEAYRQNNWTDAQLLQSGHMVRL
jgi:hypothetical protein